jgi:pimeloyl-ACP methyl ester carboxylesterase
MQARILIDGVSLAVYRAGAFTNGPTIVFLHDSLGSIALWRDFPAQLSARTACNVLVYDRRGYGLSDPFDPTRQRTKDYLQQEADILPLLLKQCGVKDTILFGHSDGGSIALIAAAKYPELFRAVITEGAHIFVEDISLEGIRAAVTAYATTDLRQRLQKYHGDKTDAVFAAWTETWLRPDFRDWNIEAFLPRIKCPVLVLQGDVDEYGSVAQVDGIVQGVSGTVESLLVPGAGHTPHKEASVVVLDAVAKFINAL